ncbi:hypothetical protein ACFYRN_09875 [Streptomyces sp. NPDC005227]|uniref:hypothetical protein n=1 Tax=Streptomyces sp. NPDC005227 TaxID=3364707 RepID=UPI0036C7CC58
MTPNEIQALICGLTAGVWIAALVQAVVTRRVERRAAAHSRKASAGSLFYAQFCLARTTARVDRALDRYRGAA